MARYGKVFRDRIVVRLLPPKNAGGEVVSREVGITVAELERWRAQALAELGDMTGGQRLTPAARLKAPISPEAIDEAKRRAWCREHVLYTADLEAWKRDAIARLGDPRAASATEAQQDRRWVKELERKLHRKDKALAETAALLVFVQKAVCGLPRGRGRLTRLEDRRTLAADITVAHSAGARVAPVCALSGIDLRTLKRWRAEDGGVLAHRLPDAVWPTSPQTLSEKDRARIVTVANVPCFADLEAARCWAVAFARRNNCGHRPSGIRYVTPAQRHAGEDGALLVARHDLYQQARARHPQRWSGRARDWSPIGAVTLTPERHSVVLAAQHAELLSGSIGAPAFLSRPGSGRARGAQRRGWEARSHPQRREHGEHCTFAAASTVASSTQVERHAS